MYQYPPIGARYDKDMLCHMHSRVGTRRKYCVVFQFERVNNRSRHQGAMKSRKTVFWLGIFLLILVVCFFIPVVVFQANHDSDCGAVDDGHDCFCLCHALVLDVPVGIGPMMTDCRGSTFSICCSRYSLLLVSLIYRPPAA